MSRKKSVYDPISMPRELPLEVFKKIPTDERILWGLTIQPFTTKPVTEYAKHQALRYVQKYRSFSQKRQQIQSSE